MAPTSGREKDLKQAEEEDLRATMEVLESKDETWDLRKARESST